MLEVKILNRSKSLNSNLWQPLARFRLYRHQFLQVKKLEVAAHFSRWGGRGQPSVLFRPLPSSLFASLVFRCFLFGRAISVFLERSFQHVRPRKRRVLEHSLRSRTLSSWICWINFGNVWKILQALQDVSWHITKDRWSLKRFFPQKWVWSDAKVRKYYGNRKMLQNADLLAKIGFDTAENEPSKKLQNWQTSVHMNGRRL